MDQPVGCVDRRRSVARSQPFDDDPALLQPSLQFRPPVLGQGVDPEEAVAAVDLARDPLLGQLDIALKGGSGFGLERRGVGGRRHASEHARRAQSFSSLGMRRTRITRLSSSR